MLVYCSHYTDEEAETQRIASGHPDQGHSSEVTALVLATPRPCCLPLDNPSKRWQDLLGTERAERLGAQRCFWACFIYFLRSRCFWICFRSPQHPPLRGRVPPATGSPATAGLQRHTNHQGWVPAPRVTCCMTMRKLPPFLNLTSSTVERRLKSSCRVRTVTDGRCHYINYHGHFFLRLCTEK